MLDAGELYQELKADVELVMRPLFEASQRFVRERGSFLPHGAVLTSAGEVRLVMALPPDHDTGPLAPAEVLPFLHEALRGTAATESIDAVGVCESVFVTVAGQEQTAAIKVLLEHRRGLCVALYMPFRRRFLRGCTFSDMFVVPAKPEVEPWRTPSR